MVTPSTVTGCCHWTTPPANHNKWSPLTVPLYETKLNFISEKDYFQIIRRCMGIKFRTDIRGSPIIKPCAVGEFLIFPLDLEVNIWISPMNADFKGKKSVVLFSRQRYYVIYSICWISMWLCGLVEGWHLAHWLWQLVIFNFQHPNMR